MRARTHLGHVRAAQWGNTCQQSGAHSGSITHIPEQCEYHTIKQRLLLYMLRIKLPLTHDTMLGGWVGGWVRMGVVRSCDAINRRDLSAQIKVDVASHYRSHTEPRTYANTHTHTRSGSACARQTFYTFRVKSTRVKYIDGAHYTHAPAT